MNNSFLVCPFQMKSVDEDDKYYYVEGMASVYGNIDLGNDIVEQGAFQEDLQEKGDQRPMLWQHRATEPIGIGNFKEMNGGLYVKFKLPKDDDFVKGRVMPQIKIGAVTGLSIGYNVLEFEYEEVDGKRICRLKKLKLHETSAVTFPMNEEARITAAKQLLEDYGHKKAQKVKAVTEMKSYSIMDSSTKWDKKKAVEQIRAKTGSAEEPTATYKNGFMFWDSENEDKYTAYKLPYTYVVDGKFQVVPRAISGIAAALSGSRGGLNVPNADKERLKTVVNGWYEKMDREPPFKGDKTFVDIGTIKAFERRDFEKLFDAQNNIMLSASAKNYVISCIQHPEEKGELEDDARDDDLLNELKKWKNIV